MNFLIRVAIRREDKPLLDKLKKYPAEPYHTVVHRILTELEEAKK